MLLKKGMTQEAHARTFKWFSTSAEIQRKLYQAKEEVGTGRALTICNKLKPKVLISSKAFL